MWEELGISGGTALIILIAFYFIIKWAVKNGIKEAYKDITGNVTYEENKEKEMIEKMQADLSNRNMKQKRNKIDK